MNKLIMMLAFIFIAGFSVVGTIHYMKNDYIADRESDKEYSIQNNCIVQGVNFNNKLYICEKELNFKQSKSIESKIAKESISTIKIKPYKDVSTNLIGTKNNINTNAIFVFNKNGDEVFRILAIDSEIILENMKTALTKYNYSFEIENK